MDLLDKIKIGVGILVGLIGGYLFIGSFLFLANGLNYLVYVLNDAIYSGMSNEFKIIIVVLALWIALQLIHGSLMICKFAMVDLMPIKKKKVKNYEEEFEKKTV